MAGPDKSQESDPQPKNLFGLGDDGPTKALLVGSTLVVMIVAALALWNRFGSRVLAAQSHSVDASSIEITEQPPWIVCDVREEAITLGSLADMSIQQTDLTPRIAQAFSLHPWVAKVKRVSKKTSPARVIVELLYRQPAAVVEMEQGLYPVDTEGVLLPPQDFPFVCKKCKQQFPVDVGSRKCASCSGELVNVATQYPRVDAGGTLPMGQPGSNWGDPRIQSAARLATVLRPIWSRYGLYRIVARQPAKFDVDRPAPTFQVVTRNNTEIYWGRGPGEEITGEPTAAKKMTRLVEFVQEHGSLDVLEPGRTIDLRDAERLLVARKDDPRSFDSGQ